MKKTLFAMCACMFLMTGCVLGVRSNMNFINHKNRAEFEGSVTDSSQYGNGDPAVNADKNYSDLLKNNAINKKDQDDKSKSEEVPEDSETTPSAE